MFKIPGYNNTVMCPNNCSHMILAERLQTHLIKCKTGANPSKKCPFNVTHLVTEKEMTEHIKNCEDRLSYDLYKYNINPQTQSGQAQPTASSTVTTELQPPTSVQMESEENWDSEQCPTYNPQLYVQNSNVIRTLNLATPSEKKAFKKSERLRLTKLEANKKQ